ncbi:MAG: DNA helicase RecG, partial [Dehalococcoidales bacterium]
MIQNAEQLRKVLELEDNKGYSDSAVIGGLDRFLQKWAGEAIESITIPRTLNRFRRLHLDNPKYATLTREQRQQWVENVLGFLTELENSQITQNKPRPAPSTKQPVKRTRVQQRPVGQSIDSPITVVKGINSSLATRFHKLGVNTVRDLLYFFPNRHLDYSQRKPISEITEGQEETVVANIWQTQETRPGGRRSTEAIVGDETGNVRVIWFNNPYLARQLKT